jgi:hypothetical protein
VACQATGLDCSSGTSPEDTEALGPLPPRFRDVQVECTDQLFDQIASGPSLRVVVDVADEDYMINHGYRVARLRDRL